MTLRYSSPPSNASTCEFCERLLIGLQASVNRHWYDFNILLETDSFVAVPALGSIVPGYLLIVSKRHAPSMAHLSDQEISALQIFSAEVMQLQTKYWGEPVIFEHGSCGDSHPAGSCIAHAHWHMVPVKWNLIPPDIQFREVLSFKEFAQQYSKKVGYLFFQRGSKNYIAEVSETRSQLFRRELARMEGKPDEWDYLASPFFEHMQETIKKIRLQNLLNHTSVTNSPTIRAYNTLAQEYYSKTCSLDTYFGLQSTIDSFISNLRGKLVLDAGAGACRDATYFMEHGLYVEAVDLAEKLLLASSASCPNHIKRLMDIRHLAYANDVFDGVWCSAVLLHLDTKDILQSLGEFYRVLKSNGVLHISLKEGEGEYKVFVGHDSELYRKFYLYTKSEVINFLAESGFTLKSVEVVQEIDSGGDLVNWIRCLAYK